MTEPKPITAWAAFDEGGIVMLSIRKREELSRFVCEAVWEQPWSELAAEGMRIAKVEIREVTK